MNKKLFIIEDDVNILYGLQAKFNLNGFKTEVDIGVDNINRVLYKIKAAKPDFIILDLILPKVDGFEIVKKLKSSKETASIPVFVFTNLSDKDSKMRGLNLGVDYYLIKNDFSINDFVVKVKKIIKNREKITKYNE